MILSFLLVPVANAQTEPPAEAPVEAPPAEAPAEPPVDAPAEVPVEDGAVEPEPEVSEPEPEVSEPEPEVSEPEPELAAPAPEGGETGRALGRTTTEEEPATAPATSTPAGPQTDANAEEPAEPDTASRLASANPVVEGINWAMPTTFALNASTRTFAPRAQPSYDPTFYLSLSVAPRYILPVKGLTVGALIGADWELTDSNITARPQQFMVRDTRLDLTYTLPYNPGGLIMIGSARALLPTSQLSIGARRYVGAAGSAIVMRPFDVLGGLILGGQMVYSYWFAGSNVPGPRGASENEIVCSDGFGASTSFCFESPGSAQHIVQGGIFVTLIPFDRAQINLSVYGQWNKSHELAVACAPGAITVDGSIPCLEDNSLTKWTTLNFVSLGIGYDVLSYMTLSLTYNSTALYPDSDGGFENFLWNEFSEVQLSAQFRPAGLAAHLQGERAAAEAEAEADAEGDADAEE